MKIRYTYGFFTNLYPFRAQSIEIGLFGEGALHSNNIVYFPSHVLVIPKIS